MSDQPNIVLIMTDQHRADHLGCYGNPVVRTPAIDSIAARGVQLNKFYVANPVCMPNRASLMTGRMPSLHGVRHNGIPLSRDHVTFVDLLAAGGYRTALVGKSHLQNFTGNPPPSGLPDIPGKTPPPEALQDADRRRRDGAAYDVENQRKWADPAHDVRLPFYGFEEARICTGHGDDVGADYRRWLADKDPAALDLAGPGAALPDQRHIAPQTWRTAVPEALYPTAYVRELSADFIARQAGGGQPFFLQVSFPDPHHPFTPPGKYWDMYDPDDIELPASFDKGDLEPLRHLRDELAQGAADRDGPTRPFAVTAEEARAIIALTYGMITMVDDAVADILLALEGAGVAENTVVIFTSDHGDYMADHGLMLKYLLHYQGLVRVPFIAAGPGVGAAGTRQELGGTIDIAPTILGLAGLQPFNGVQGRDLFDPSQPAPDGVIVEEDSNIPMFGATDPDRVRTLITGRWRLTCHQAGDWWELYDLQSDPDENRNLWGTPEAADITPVLLQQMIGRMMALGDTSPLPTGRA
jgi:arylsulfatase A-like enzyme